MKALRRVLKWTGIGLAAILVVCSALVVQSWYFRPFSIDIFFERVFAQFLLREPEALSSIGLFHQLGYRGFDDELGDLSPEHAEELARLIRRDLEQLHGYNRASLTPSQQMSYDVLDWFLQDQADGERWLYHDYPVNQNMGEPNATLEFLIRVHPLDDAQDARTYIARLEAIPKKFDGLKAGLTKRESKGVIAPKFVLDQVLEQTRSFLASPADQSVLYTHLREKLEQMKSVSPTERDSLLKEAKQAIETRVQPAFRDVSAFLIRQRDKAQEEYGVWALPDGDAYYDYLIRHHTTTTMDAKRVHEIGLADVARLEKEIDVILREQGLTEGSIGARIAQLSADPRQQYTNDDAGRAQCLADFQHAMDEMVSALPRAFVSIPRLSVRAARMPLFNEGSGTAAYADSGSLDGSRPPTFYVNLRDMAGQPRFSVRTLTYHEGVPGHLLEGMYANSLSGVPTFRKVVPFTAYAEGWALYSERLGWELGFENDPLDNLGRLQHEIFRAARLVVDTGIHHEHWTRAQAVDYLVEKTGQSRDTLSSEVDRYFVMPGQALAYKVGMQKFLDLRAAARERLGDRFDLREFHRAALSEGELPLGLLEARITHWIDSASAPVSLTSR